MSPAVNIFIQYVLVGAAFIASLIWVIYKIVKLQRRQDNGCCGCSLSDACGKKELKEKIRSKKSSQLTKPDCCHEDNKNME